MRLISKPFSIIWYSTPTMLTFVSPIGMQNIWMFYTPNAHQNNKFQNEKDWLTACRLMLRCYVNHLKWAHWLSDFYRVCRWMRYTMVVVMIVIRILFECDSLVAEKINKTLFFRSFRRLTSTVMNYGWTKWEWKCPFNGECVCTGNGCKLLLT